MSDLDVSIVFVVYRTPEFLERALHAIGRVSPRVSYEILVEDNAPEDSRSETVAQEWAAQGLAPLRYRKNERNLGLARALNQGIADAASRSLNSISAASVRPLSRSPGRLAR